MIEEAFAVATEFRFDVGEAILGTNQLTQAVDSLDQSVTRAVSGLSFMATHLAARLGLGAGGLLGILTQAFHASEEFNSDALNFSQNITTNMQYLTGTVDTFNQRLESSQAIMNDISRVAREAGLNGRDLGMVVSRIASPLAVHGKLGHNYEGGISMARNLMLSAQATGMNPGVAVESLSRALTDRMALHGALFTRLINTPAFRDAHVKTQGQLIGMDTGKKIDLLNKSLAQLGGNAEFMAARLNLISVQFTILKDNIANMLRPIGDALMVPLRQIFNKVNAALAEYGPKVGQYLGNMLNGIFNDPKGFIATFMQLRNLKSDAHRAFSWVSNLMALGSVMELVGLKFGFAQKIATGVKGLLGTTEAEGFLEIILGTGTKIGKVFRILSTAFMEFLPNVMALMFLFQVLSRAMAIAKINDLIYAISVAPRFVAALVKMKDALAKILEPLYMAIDGAARLIAVLFETEYAMDVVIILMEKLANVMMAFGEIISWMLRITKDEVMLMQELAHDKVVKNPDIFHNLWDNIKKIGSDIMTLPKGPVHPSPVANINNHNHIEARFDMREQLEPDRVAFAVTEHLKHLTINATQGKGSLHSGFANPHQRTAGAR